MEDFDIENDPFLQSLDCFLIYDKNIARKTTEYKKFAEDVYLVDFEKSTNYSNAFEEKDNSCFGKVLDRYDEEVIICIFNISSCEQISCTRFHSNDAFEKAIKIASLIDYNKLNALLESALIYCHYPWVSDERIKRIGELINPLMIDKGNFRYDEYFEDPFDKKFEEYINLVNSLPIPVNTQHQQVFSCTSHQPLNNKNHTQSGQILFIHNNIPYYGDRNAMYETLLFLPDDIKYDDDEPFVLSGSITKKSMNHYIDGSCCGKFNISDIDYSDILQFMKFIEQYPTKIIFLEKLEGSIIDYFEDGYKDNKMLRELIAGQEMNDLITRCRLKYLYLYLHNKTYWTKNIS